MPRSPFAILNNPPPLLPINRVASINNVHCWVCGWLPALLALTFQLVRGSVSPAPIDTWCLHQPLLPSPGLVQLPQPYLLLAIEVV